MGAFQLTYLRQVKDKFQTTTELNKSFENFYGRLPTNVEEQI